MSGHRMSIGYHYACILAPTVERVEDQVGWKLRCLRCGLGAPVVLFIETDTPTSGPLNNIYICALARVLVEDTSVHY